MASALDDGTTATTGTTPHADVLLVSHTHWDREWYRTFEGFRARLVDTIDRVLDLFAVDGEWRFVLDGQAIVVEDYLEVRPGRRAELEAAVSSGRLAIGPWYVQPDSLLPAGESHIRNLLEGRRVATGFGECSSVAYTPDSFGHPAQFPQIFAGFGLGPFVYWRGNGSELDELGPLYRWAAPDGSVVTAYHLERGYFCAAGLSTDPEEAATALVGVLDRMPGIAGVPTLLMNGIDHMLPDAHTAAVACALEARTGRRVRRVLLDELRSVDATDRPTFSGPLLGGRAANLLPGVWSSRLPLKLANRRAERALLGWAEPWVALGRVFGLPDERPSLSLAWRALLANHAHDSIGGCSQDEVHRQMHGRFATATELAEQTTARVLERLAGLGAERRVPWSTELDIAVFNASPIERTDVVRVPLEGFPIFALSDQTQDIHPLAIAKGLTAGFTVDGAPGRVVPSDDPGRFRVLDEWQSLDLEFVARAVPAMGWRRFHIAPSDFDPETHDDGREIDNGAICVTTTDDGTLVVDIGGRTFTGLVDVEDQGDRGDTYDFDPVDEGPGLRLDTVDVARTRHASGHQRLVVTRHLSLPESLDVNRRRRSDRTAVVVVRTEVAVAPHVDRVDLSVTIDNTARDHRLRLLFPTGVTTTRYRYATTLDVAESTVGAPDDREWKHPAPRTRPHQGWVEANGLCVSAPGLPEFEVTDEGVIAVTLLRSVGWLSRFDLANRPEPAGPGLFTPDAQCIGTITARLTLRLDASPDTLAADEMGLRGVPAGSDPLVPPGRSLVVLAPSPLVLSTLKPAADGDGIIVRVLNPTDATIDAALVFGVPVVSATSCRLDEEPDGQPVTLTDSGLAFPIGPHAARSARVRPGGATG